MKVHKNWHRYVAFFTGLPPISILLSILRQVDLKNGEKCVCCEVER